jgi:hypothetical protein
MTPEFSAVKTLAFEAINRNRNERQKTVLLIHASGIMRTELLAARNESALIRTEKAHRSRELKETRAHLSAEADARARELAESGQKKPVQSLRFIASV